MSFQIVCLHYTKCTLGEADIHTQKWILSGEKPRNCSITELHPLKNVTKPSIKIGYKSDTSDMFELWFSYPETCDIEIRTMQSKSMEKQILKVQSIKSDSWNYFAKFKYADICFSTITIQLYITKIKKKVDYKLIKDFNNLFKDGLFSDCTIESCDGVSFKVHKGVLASRSDVFKAHFENDSTESQTGIIKSAFNAEVLTELLNYIYSDVEAINLDKVPERLFVAADFYQLTDLKGFCEDSLYKQLTVENVIDTLKLADSHSASNLKKLAMEFFQLHAKIIFTNPAWADLKSTEILKALCEHVMEDSIQSIEQTKLHY